MYNFAILGVNWGGLIAAAISSNDKIYAAPFIEDLFQVFMWHNCNALWIYSVDLGVQIDQSESQVLTKFNSFFSSFDEENGALLEATKAGHQCKGNIK